MLHHSLARPSRRAIVVSVVTAAFGVAAYPSAAAAQWRAAWDANASFAQFETPRAVGGATPLSPSDAVWFGQRTIGGALRFNNPFVQLNADGVVRDGDVSSRATGNVTALFASPSWNGFRVSAFVNQRHVPNDGLQDYRQDSTSLALYVAPTKIPTWQSNASASVAYARNAAGIWFRANSRQGAGTSDSLSRWAFASGLNYQVRGVVLGISMGTQSVGTSTHWVNSTIVDVPPHSPGNNTDSSITRLRGDSGYTNAWRRWSETSATLGWSTGRFALDAMVSARARLGTNRAATWGEAAGTVAVTSRVAVVASMRTTPPLPGVQFAERRVASVGLRVAPPAFWRPAATSPVRTTSRAFNVKASAPGEYTITLTVPYARSVEIAGDFTAWKAVELRQINNTRWEIVLKVGAGSHRCNVRIDGADWIAPPGVPTINDEFNGRVGLFVAE